MGGPLRDVRSSLLERCEASCGRRWSVNSLRLASPAFNVLRSVGRQVPAIGIVGRVGDELYRQRRCTQQPALAVTSR